MLRALLCRLLRHNHGRAVIMLTFREGGGTTSQVMDAWDAEWVVANVITPTASWLGRDVASCRVVLL